MLIGNITSMNISQDPIYSLLWSLEVFLLALVAFRPEFARAIKPQQSQFKFNQLLYGELQYSKLGEDDVSIVFFPSDNACWSAVLRGTEWMCSITVVIGRNKNSLRKGRGCAQRQHNEEFQEHCPAEKMETVGSVYTIELYLCRSHHICIVCSFLFASTN